MSKFPLVYVRWMDAVHPESGWIDSTDVEADPAMLCETAGWLVRKSDTAVQVCVTQTQDDDRIDVSGVFVIPVGCILSIQTIALPKAK